MVVCNDELCASFKNLHSADRIDLMCGLLQLCVPLELRFIGACLEELARKDYSRLRDFETKANDYAALRETRVDELSKETCGALSVYLSLLHSDNSFCAHALYEILTRIKSLVDGVVSMGEGEGRASIDLELADDLILLFTLSLHHPAFTFSQRLQLFKDYVTLKMMLGIGSIPLKNGDLEDEKSKEFGRNEAVDEVDGSESAKSIVQNSSQLNTEVEPVCLKDITLKSTACVEGRSEFHLEIILSDTSVTNVVKTYPELSEFHRQFAHQFPNDSSQLPFLPSESSKQTVELVKEYLRKFVLLPRSLLKCSFVVDFFLNRNAVSSSSSYTSSSSSSSSSSALVLVVPVVPVTQSTITITPSNNQTNISSRNCVGNSESVFVSDQEAGHRGNRIRSLTVYNSHLADHGSKRGGDLHGKAFRSHTASVARVPVASTIPPNAPVPRHPWLISQASAVNLPQTRLCDGTAGCAAVCISPCLSVTSVCTSPQPPSISPPQSATSNNGSIQLSQSHSSILDASVKLKQTDRHNDYLSANLCYKSQCEPGEDPHLHQQSTFIHRSKSEQDHRQISSNGVPPGFGSLVADASTSLSDCQSVAWCVQNIQVQDPTPLIWNAPGIGTPMVIPKISKGLALGLHPIAVQEQCDQEQCDANDQDKNAVDDLYSVINDDRLNAAYGPQQLTVNPGIETPGYSGFSPSNVKTLPFVWDPTSCYVMPGTLMKSSVLLPVATQTQSSSVTKPARAILGASHHRGSTKAPHPLENGEKRHVVTTQEVPTVATRATVTTAQITISSQSMTACDNHSEKVGSSSPVLVSSESALARPSNLNVSSMTLSHRPKIINNDLKGKNGPKFGKISASRSVATVSTGVDTRGGVTGYYSDVPATNSTPFPAPGNIVIQRISSLPAGTQPFSYPPTISSIPVIYSSPPVTSAVPTPSTTPPILSLASVNLTGNGVSCTSCQCMQCSMQALPFSFPFIWPPSHLVPSACIFNGFINSHNLSFPPPSLPPHVPLGSIFNGMNNDMVYNIAQAQVPAPVPPPPPPPPHLNHPSVMNAPLFTTSHCIPFHPSFPPPVHIQNSASAVKTKMFCPNCGSNDHAMNACTEKASVLSQTAQFRLNPCTKQPSD